VPSPATWANAAVSARALRNDVSDAVNFLANRPQFAGLNDVGPSIGGGGGNVAVPMTIDVNDPWQGHDPLGTNPDAWYLPPNGAGWYLVNGFAGWNYQSAPQVTFAAALKVVQVGGTVTENGESLPSGSSQYPGPKVCDLVLLTRTGLPNATTGVDTVSLLVSQNSGGPLNLAVNPPAPVTLQPWLTLRWVCSQTGTAPLAVPANAAALVPPSFIDEGWLNTNVRDTIRFLVYPPVFRGRLSAAASLNIPNQVFPASTALPLDTITVDNYGGWNNVTGWAAPVAGQYCVYAQAGSVTPSSAGSIACGIGVNGTSTVYWGKVWRGAATSSAVTVAAAKRVRLNAGDLVSIRFGQNTGSALTLSGPTRLIAVWEGS
jgi:hypothetical protein